MRFQVWLVVGRLVASTMAVAFLDAIVAEVCTATTLAPVVIGSTFESTPFDGNADGTSDVPYIGTNNSQRHRAIFEFDLTNLPLGTVNSATLSGLVSPNNSFDTGTRVENVEVFSANGSINLSDYNVPGTNVGMLSHPSGGASSFNFSIGPVLQSLINSGAAHLGVRISPTSDFQAYDVVDDSAPPSLTISLTPATTIVQTLFTAVDAQGQHPSGAIPTVSDGGTSFVIQRTASSTTDKRTIMEFNLHNIPDNATIVSATLKAQIFSFTQSTGQNPQPSFYGYPGDGASTTADLDQTARLIGTASPINASGNFSTELDAAYVQSLLSTSDYLGVLGVGNPNGQSVQFWTWEARSFASPPTLSLVYALPPLIGDYNGNGSVGADDFAVWKSTFGATSGDLRADGNHDDTVNAADYTIWRDHFSGAGSAAVAAQAPEPATFGLLLFTGIILACSRTQNSFFRIVRAAQ